jgi:hypothetical protein
MRRPAFLSRYSGAVVLNAIAYFIPALYGTLSKLWIAQIDWTMVATTDLYTYMGVISEIVNEGLPRASFLVIGDKKIEWQGRVKLSTHC